MNLHKNAHQIMNLEDLMLAAPQSVNPEKSRKEEEQGHHEVENWQWHFSSRQIVSIVVFLNVSVKRKHIALADVLVVVWACM